MYSSPTSLDIRIQISRNQTDRKTQAEGVVQKLYQEACNRGWLDKIRSSLGMYPHRLLDLTMAYSTCKGFGHRYLGKQYVAINQIQGSANEGRCRDFDADFRPLKSHNEERWLNVALARQQGAKLPPVALIQVEDVYFVQDGHHRISVARALGEDEIEAVVTLWQVSGQLPWERAKNQVETSLRINAISEPASLL